MWGRDNHDDLRRKIREVERQRDEYLHDFEFTERDLIERKRDVQELESRLHESQCEYEHLKREIGDLIEQNELLLDLCKDYDKLLHIILQRFNKDTVARMIIDMFLSDTSIEELSDKVAYVKEHFGIKFVE